MSLNPQQQNVARKIIAEGHQLNAPRHVIRVALATALTEANLENPHGGDASSIGAFQQQSSGWGSPAERMNPRTAARSFYQAAIPLFHQGQRGGQLAQSVQRSAFPGRYQPNLAEAGSILRGMGDTPQPKAPPTVTNQTQTQTQTVQPITMLPNPTAPALATAGPVFPTTRPGEVQRLQQARQSQIGPLNTQGTITKDTTTTTSTPAPVQQQPQQDGMVQQALQAAKSVKGTPYRMGGGHAGFSPHPSTLDCSGAVSLVLHKIGVVNTPLTSGAMGSVLKPGPGAITVFYNAGHTFMRFETPHGPVYWGTSVGDSGSGGLGKHPAPSAGYLSAYKVGHVPGAGAAQVAAITKGQKVKQPQPTTTQSVRVTNGVYTQTPIFSNRPIASDTSNPSAPTASTSSGLEGRVRQLLR